LVTPRRSRCSGHRGALIVLAALVIGWTAAARAQTPALPAEDAASKHPQVLTPQEPTPEGILAVEPAAEIGNPQLRRLVPGLAEDSEELPPFVRDMYLRLHVRSFYFNRVNSSDSQNEALAQGGWLAIRSGWLWKSFALGAAGYTSLPLYAPQDTGGTGLLRPTPENPQDSILVLGQAYAMLRYEDYALVTGYRQLVNEGYLNPQDSRMVPKTFEGVTMKGTLGPIGYDVGYLSAIKLRQDDRFQNMAEAAGVVGKSRGLVLTRLSAEPVAGLSLYAANYLVPDVFNTVYGFAEYTHELGTAVTLKTGVQTTDQRSVGSAFLGTFATWNVNTRAILVWRGFGVGAGFSATGGATLQTPYGDAPGYFTFQENQFTEAHQKAWGVAARYDFGPGTLLPAVHVPGLSLLVRYAQGWDATDSTTGSRTSVREGDLDVIWNVREVTGLQFRFRNAYVAKTGQSVVPAFRIILNYELPLL